MSDRNVTAAHDFIERHLHPESWRDHEATIRCPLPQHPDHVASATANDERRAWHCHGCGAGGKLSDLAATLGVPAPTYHNGNGHHPAAVHRLPIGGTAAEAVWRYCDRAGAPLVEVVKYHKADGKRKTAIRHRPEWHPTLTPKKPAKRDGWSWCYPDIGGGLLYRVRELHGAADTAPLANDEGATVQGADGRAVHLNAAAVAALAVANLPPVLVVEGEKDVDRLRSLGFTATCNFNGAGKWGDGHTQSMPAGRDVVILADADKPGMKHAETVAAALQNGYRGNGKARSVRIVDPEQLGFPVIEDHGPDVSDWLEADPTRGAAEVQGLIDSAAPAPATEQPASGDTRPNKGGIDAGEAAMALAPPMADRFMFAEGRGWFVRPSATALWRPASGATMTGEMQATGTWWACKRGTRTSAILGELTGQLAVDGALLDADDWTCGLPAGAGILDVRTGETRPSTADDRVTKALRVVPDFTAPPEVLPWYLAELTAGCREPEKVQEFIRWYWRRSLTGDCSAEVLMFLYGPPRTGKSKLGELMLYIAGDYGHFLDARNIVGNGVEFQHPTWLAACAGKRLILASDLPPRGSWQTGTVQDAVSGSPMTARQMRQDGFTFQSQMHFVCTGNHAPRAPHGAGIWDRLRMVACKNQHTKNPITTLPERLKAEAPRILGWVLGAPDEQPNVPELGDMAANMRDESDPVGGWIKQTWRYDADGCIPAAECYRRYSDVFGADHDVQIMGERSFGELMTEQYGEPSFNRKLGGKSTKVRRLAAL